MTKGISPDWRSATGRTCIALFLSTFVMTFRVTATEPPPTPPGEVPVTPSFTTAVLDAKIFAPNIALAPDVPTVAPQAFVEPTPSFLISMYEALAALQAYDTYATLIALHGGAKAANPVLRREERDWVRQRAAAFALMVAAIGRMEEAVVPNAAVSPASPKPGEGAVTGR